MGNNLADELIEFMIDKYCSKDDSIFYGNLMVLKRYADLENVERGVMRSLVNMLTVIEDSITKATLIEVIVEFLAFQYENGEKTIYDRHEELLDQYIYLISENAINIEEVKKCLRNFIDLDINKNKIFNKIAKNLEERDVIQLIMGIGYTWDDIPREYEDIYKKVKEGEKIRFRSYIVSTFLLIVHPLCSKYEYSNCVSIEYPSLLSAVEDWEWQTPGSTGYLVKQGVITIKEGNVLERLGELLKSNIKLNSNEIRNLYNEFFQDKNPYDVMFTLPDYK